MNDFINPHNVRGKGNAKYSRKVCSFGIIWNKFGISSEYMSAGAPYCFQSFVSCFTAK